MSPISKTRPLEPQSPHASQDPVNFVVSIPDQDLPNHLMKLSSSAPAGPSFLPIPEPSRFRRRQSLSGELTHVAEGDEKQRIQVLGHELEDARIQLTTEKERTIILQQQIAQLQQQLEAKNQQLARGSVSVYQVGEGEVRMDSLRRPLLPRKELEESQSCCTLM